MGGSVLLDDFLTPAVVQSKVIPALNEGVVGRPLHSFSWSASDQQQWWDWAQIATEFNHNYDWANPPIVSLTWSQVGTPQSQLFSDTYMDLSCNVKGPPTKYTTALSAPLYDASDMSVSDGFLTKVDPFVTTSIDWDEFLNPPADTPSENQN